MAAGRSEQLLGMLVKGVSLELVGGTGDQPCTAPDGVGTGWLGGIRYRGEVEGREVDARGYFEYVDRR